MGRGEPLLHCSKHTTFDAIVYQYWLQKPKLYMFSIANMLVEEGQNRFDQVIFLSRGRNGLMLRTKVK